MYKNLLLYWGRSKPLSYFRFLTVKSFKELNPDWNIIIAYSIDSKAERAWNIGIHERDQEYVGEDFFSKLEDIATTVFYDFSDTIVKNEHDIHKSDYVRWHLLKEYGGVWSDFDIYYIRPISTLNIKKGFNIVKYLEDKFAIGFIAADRGHETLDIICNSLESSYNPSVFQCIGANLLHKLEPELVYNKLPKESVYPVTYREINNINNIKIHNNTIGIHWYGGSRYMGSIEENVKKTNEWTNSIKRKGGII